MSIERPSPKFWSRGKNFADPVKKTLLKTMYNCGTFAPFRWTNPELPAHAFKPMKWGQAQKMDADGVRIEPHTVTHPILTKSTAAELDFEMQTSKKRLEEVLGRPVDHFCYPDGSLDDTVRAAAASAGYATAVTTKYGFNDSQTDPFLLNRIDAPAALENFAHSASGFEAARLAMLKP